MMRVKVLSDGANGRIILSSAIEMGCGLPDPQIFAHFGSPRCIKSRTLPRSLQRRLRRHTTEHAFPGCEGLIDQATRFRSLSRGRLIERIDKDVGVEEESIVHSFHRAYKAQPSERCAGVASSGN